MSNLQKLFVHLCTFIYPHKLTITTHNEATMKRWKIENQNAKAFSIWVKTYRFYYFVFHDIHD